MSAIPATMRAMFLESERADLGQAIRALRVRELDVPRPGGGEVLVRVEAAPCNPSDLLVLTGASGRPKTLPTVPGWEASGVVVAAGRGLLPRLLHGRRVACGSATHGFGTWAEYFVAKANGCIPLRKAISFEQGATILVNPVTARAMLHEARTEGHKAGVQSAAGSQLGRYLRMIAERADFPLIHLVRRADQAAALVAGGAPYVLCTSEPDFPAQLRRAIDETGATVAFDAVGGFLATHLLKVLPEGGEVISYGLLSSEPVGVDPADLIFGTKSLRGFFLADWAARQTLWRLWRTTQAVQKDLAKQAFATDVAIRAGFEDWPAALERYQVEQSAGKPLLVPQHSRS